MKKLYSLGLSFLSISSYAMDQSPEKSNPQIAVLMKSTMVDFDEVGLWVALSNSGYRKIAELTLLHSCLARFSPMSLSDFMPIITNAFDEYWKKESASHSYQSKEEYKKYLIKAILNNQPNAVEILKQNGVV